MGKKTPPLPRDEPAAEAKAAAWDWTSGSRVACSERTQSRTRRKSWFSVKLVGVGGMAVLVPMARERVGGFVGRRERMWELEELEVSGKMY